MNEKVTQILISPDWTNAEKQLIKWQFNLHGSFYTALFDAIQKADPINLKLLEKGFPDEVQGFRQWQNENGELADRIDEAIGL